MPNLNKVFLIGHLGREPEVKMSKGGTLYGNVSLATSFGYGDDRKTAWHRIVFFGKSAEYMRDNAHKGDALHVEGRIEYDRWEDKEGNTHMVAKILSDRIQLLGKRPKPADVSPPGDSWAQNKAGIAPSGAERDDDAPF